MQSPAAVAHFILEKTCQNKSYWVFKGIFPLKYVVHDIKKSECHVMSPFTPFSLFETYKK